LRESVSVKAAYRSWSVSHEWGLTMAEIRAANFAKWRAHDDARRDLELMSAMSDLATAFQAAPVGPEPP
jgi:hypothetical protein